ncbi:YybH family protein [Shewanella sedimentimangrovi]|uniref:SgcJ/EcaC family oxidoreductase n=1 Tax=Shewanella sedimentimangrovi TaxID=2814293 RepID=A0ABX7R1A6_9GAMM|nr:SgcJ/EcaC family oxidoreductase [Shewanella sedimentimangrovi]QSX37249.1 SgcJ/EcaC family oxidoreductase [Shewanella sedimentimangrovi]
MLLKGLAASLLLVCCAVTAEPGDEVMALLRQQQAAWNQGSIDDYMAGYWHSDNLRVVSGDRFRYGWESVRAAYRKHYPTREAMGQLTFSQVDIKILGNDAALIVGRWSLMRERDNPSGAFSLLLEKIDERWVITHDHSSD